MSSFDACELAVPGVAQLQPYQPGKPMAELQREYGVSEIIKLASNENPLGASPRALEAVEGALETVHRYPDGNGFELKHALADHHGVDPACITLGNGSNDVLDLVARAFLGPGRSAVFAEHAFAVYPIATRSAGADAQVVPALAPDAEQAYGHDLAAMARRVDADTRVVFVANPNNPTGTWCRDDEVVDLLEQVPRDVVVVLDEAYVEYAHVPGYAEATRHLRRYPNLVVTRTFSKAHGLAGLRVGYALSDPAIADVLNRVRHPFNCNALAQAAAAAALGDDEFMHRSVALNAEQRPRLVQAIEALGARVLPSAGNFICVALDQPADRAYEGLLRRGVIVRPLAGYGLPNCLRISVGTAEENERCITALAEVLQP